MSLSEHNQLTDRNSTESFFTPVAFSSSTTNGRGGTQTEYINENLLSCCTDYSEEELTKKYNLQKCRQWINDNQFQRISLQFPDELLVDAAAVTSWLEENVSAQVFILGDTSYGSCCIDEVAAQHYNADSVIHFGYSCLNPTKRLPVLFIFDQQQVDVNDCCEKFHHFFPCPESKVLLFYDVRYSFAIGEIKICLKNYKNLITTELNIPQNDPKTSDYGHQFQLICKCNRFFTLQESESVEEYCIYFIGEQGPLLLNLMYNFSKCPFFTYNPRLQLAQQETLQNRHLMRRYYLIEKIKDANVIGILAGTLGVSDYLSCIHHLEHLIQKAGKKTYTFVVGKLNLPKLSNFLEIDLFVLVACSENTLIDSKEFYQPIVTPFEVEIALNPNRQWTGDYFTDFRLLLPGAACYIPVPEEGFDDTDVSLITGKIRTLGEDNDPPEESNVILTRPDALSVTTLNAKTAGEFLNQRSWQGLEQNLGETPITKAVEGDTGIAWSYTQELTPSKND